MAVERGGGCAFSDKALAAQAGGALACVVMDTKPDQEIMRLMAAPEEADKVVHDIHDQTAWLPPDRQTGASRPNLKVVLHDALMLLSCCWWWLLVVVR